ncbi:FAD-dependent oxidoreductase [Ramlibacter humi]|uniref:FAD-dependent oxidoreductase n=1 Tax=Ramlibacter humi TaxID=2530451 RepID=A0A4Z0C1J8_9BURK|nr:FAD-dependent oxidoreductase [Ramlibacter humi]TFZ04109.1 FAD-dependent oxidoreductase [Ramlibacter humi]
MAQDLLVAGGGIAGLAAAIGARRAGWEARLFEQATAFSEAGAGLQLGPNATRVLREWGVLQRPELRPFQPARLSVRDAVDGREIGTLRLGETAASRYGAPYFTVHRADLQAALLAQAAEDGVFLHEGTRVESLEVRGDMARARLQEGGWVEADAAAVADGVWSRLRAQLLDGSPAPATGHVAYRALLQSDALPVTMQGDHVEAWLGPRMHLVRYPVRGGEAMNIVGFIEGRAGEDWDQAASVAALREAAKGLCAPLRTIVEAVPEWRLWPVHDRAPVAGDHEMAEGRAALLGDAAHPMRPYLAQGAGMALEDAAALERVLRTCDGRVIDVPTALRRYALDRWQRCARVQARSLRNGRIFHADGALRVARNLAMKTVGEPLLDLPWLYGGP